ncbi:MAG TPA: DMT family transporter [Turneriella sp.]|nr:DMT family transporter [Turneriella sp.]
MTIDTRLHYKNKFVAGLVFTILGAAGFSAKAILAKLCYRYGITGFATLTLRMLFALPLYAIIFTYYFRRETKEIQTHFKRDIFVVSLVGLFGYYLASWFDFVGLEYISASFERLLLFIYPTLVLFISLVWLKKRAGRREIAALVITYIGIGVAYHNEAASLGEKAHIGAVYIVLAAITYAIYLVATEKLSKRYSPMVFTSFAILVSAFAILIHSWIMQEKIWGFPREVYYYTVAMAIFCTVIPSLLIALGIAYIGSNRAAILSALGPVLTIYLAYLVLGEDVNLIQTIGTVFVIGGVALLTIKPKQEKHAESLS